jgi:hypothetical protein
VNSEIIKLFKLIQERNILAFDRSRKRSKASRLRDKFKKTDSLSKELIKEFNLAFTGYKNACKKLAAFTKKHRKFRNYAKSKYLTRQKTDASNHIVGMSLTLDGQRHVFSIKDIEKQIQEAEIEQILLGVPQI